jgi:hypothetical protein
VEEAMSRIAKFTLFALLVATAGGLSLGVWGVFAPDVEREARTAAEPAIPARLHAVSIADLFPRSR